MNAYGVFNDEGCIEAGLADMAAAEAAAKQYQADGDEYAEAAEICPDHEEQRRVTCEECDGGDDGAYDDEDHDAYDKAGNR